MQETNTKPPDAVVIIDSDGRYRHATEAALQLLGVSLDELRSLAAGALSSTPEEDRQALLAEFSRTGSQAAVGEATVLRPRGERVRVRFTVSAQADGSYVATMEPVAGPVDAPPRVLAIGDVLSAWRAAERRLERLEPGTAEYVEAASETRDLRAQYAALFRRQQER